MVDQVNVKVNPKARLNRVEDDGAGGFIVWTTAAPENGHANEAVARALADHLGIAKSCVLLRRGVTSRRKVFDITK